MPRDGSGVYTRPVGTNAVPDTTIESAKYNNNVADVETDLNTPRPIVAGGTGGTSADVALTNLSGEKAKQIVTDWNMAVSAWRPGSFYAATSAAGTAPVTGHAFAGTVYYANATDLVCEATDLTDPTKPLQYIRTMTAGVWGAWTVIGASLIGSQAVRYDIAQGLTTVQQVQARANIGALKKNYILNGAMQVSQENGATAGTVNNYYAVDQFSYLTSVTTAVVSVAQVASVTPAGSPNRLRATVTTADAAMTTNKYVVIRQALEGLRTADLKMGTASAKQITLQFGVKAPAGTYSVALINATLNRSYVAEYTIAAGEANTDVVKTVSLTLDITGTWASDTTAGIYLQWVLMGGPTFQTPANIWTAANLFISPNQFNLVGTNGNVFELFDVSLTEGSAAPTFQVPDYPSELALCRRYWQRNLAALDSNWSTAGQVSVQNINFIPEMRGLPTATYGTALVGPNNTSGPTTSTIQSYGVVVQMIQTTTSRAYWYGPVYSNARL